MLAHYPIVFFIQTFVDLLRSRNHLSLVIRSTLVTQCSILHTQAPTKVHEIFASSRVSSECYHPLDHWIDIFQQLPSGKCPSLKQEYYIQNLEITPSIPSYQPSHICLFFFRKQKPFFQLNCLILDKYTPFYNFILHANYIITK